MRRAPLIDQSQTGCQSPQPRDTAAEQRLSVSIKVSALCVLIGNKSTQGIVIKMTVYKRLSSHQRSPHGPGQYGFVDAVPPSGVRHQTDAAAGAFCLTLWSFHFPVHRYIKQLYAALRDVEKDWTTPPRQLLPERKQMLSEHARTLRLRTARSPSLQLFATGTKLLQKGAKDRILPCETNISISCRYTGVSLSP